MYPFSPRALPYVRFGGKPETRKVQTPVAGAVKAMASSKAAGRVLLPPTVEPLKYVARLSQVFTESLRETLTGWTTADVDGTSSVQHILALFNTLREDPVEFISSCEVCR